MEEVEIRATRTEIQEVRATTYRQLQEVGIHAAVRPAITSREADVLTQIRVQARPARNREI